MKPDMAQFKENQELRQRIGELTEQVQALQMMLQTAPPVQRKYITRPCTTPGCENMALFDPLTDGPALCIECRLEIP